MCQYNKMFSHVYVEKGVAEHPRTKQILEKLNNTTVIEIDHYKDVFCRKKQSISAQSNAKALILAENTSGCIYEGAPVCQSFGNENFYYCSCMMNCIFDCEYCYLKGMYPSATLGADFNCKILMLLCKSNPFPHKAGKRLYGNEVCII